MKRSLNIAVFGLSHLGLTYSVGFAKLQFNVTGFDFDKKIINSLSKGISHIFEPGFKHILKNHLHKNLYYTAKPKDALTAKDYLFVTFDLSLDKSDNVNVGILKKSFEIIAKNYTAKTTIVISSQVPLGTCEKLVNYLLKSTRQKVNLIYFPENLIVGSALESFLRPERMIIGATDSNTAKRFTSDFSCFNCPIFSMSIKSAEMVKHTLNSFLATCISFSSEISDLCELTGADINDVVKALRSDSRVGKFVPISAGLGYSGPTLARDIKTLINLARVKKYRPKLMQAVRVVNQDRLTVLIRKIKSVYPKLSEIRVGILGLTYKPKTNITVKSQSLALATLLHEEKSKIKAYDPAIKNKIKTHPFLEIKTDLYELFEDLDLLILMTPWEEFRHFYPNRVGNLMRKKVIIDSKNFLDYKMFQKNGFKYIGIGMNNL